MRRGFPLTGQQGQALALAGVALAALWVAIGVAQAGADAAAAAQRDSRFAHQVHADSLAVLIGMVDQEAAIRGYAGTGAASFLAPYRTGRDQTAAGLTAVASETRGTSLAAAAAPVRLAVARWQAWAEGRRAVVDSAGRAVADAAGAATGEALFAGFRTAGDRLVGLAGRRAGASEAEAERRAGAVRPSLLVAAAAVTVVIGLLAARLVTGTIRPVLRLAHAAARLAADGAAEPDAMPGAGRRDEVGALARSLHAWRRPTPSGRR